MPVFVSPADESNEEEEAKEVTKEEHELGVVKSWIEMGDILVLAKRKCRDYCVRYILFIWYGSVFQPILSLPFFLSLIFVMDPFFQGLDPLKKASALNWGKKHNN